jgi:TRAP-type C4-dicarboxylate transport system substrate-binding protein
LKKKLVFLALAALLVVSAVFAGCQTTPSDTPTPDNPSDQVQTIELGLNSMQPATHYVITEQLPAYFKKVEDAAGGKYKLDINYYPAGALVAPDKTYDSVVQGVVDMGQACFSYTPGRFPIMWTMYKPGVAPPNDCNAASAGIWEYYNTMKPAELDDVHVLLLWAVGPGWLHTHEPVTTVEDMKGLKIRSTGAFVDAVKLVGAEPVSMPMSDTYLAAQKGLIDATVSPNEALETFKFSELFPYSTFLPTFYSHFQFLVMNQDKWNSLPKDLQDAFNAVADETITEAGEMWEYYNTHGKEFAAAESGGHEFIILSDAEEGKLLEAIEPVRESYIEELNSKGFDGEEIVNTAHDIMEKCNAQTYGTWNP